MYRMMNPTLSRLFGFTISVTKNLMKFELKALHLFYLLNTWILYEIKNNIVYYGVDSVL